MLSRVLSSAVFGIDAYTVEVEVDIAQGLPAFATVGLPEGAVKESKDRVKAAVKNCGYEFPPRRITVYYLIRLMVSDNGSPPQDQTSTTNRPSKHMSLALA